MLPKEQAVIIRPKGQYGWKPGESYQSSEPYQLAADTRYAPIEYPVWPIPDGTRQVQIAGQLSNQPPLYRGRIDSTV